MTIFLSCLLFLANIVPCAPQSLHQTACVRPGPRLGHHRLLAQGCRQTNYFRDGTKWGDFMPDKPDFMFSYEGLIWCGKSWAAQFSGSKRPPNLNATPLFRRIKYFCPTRLEYFYVKNICHNIWFSGTSADLWMRKKRACSNCFSFFLDLLSQKPHSPKLFSI